METRRTADGSLTLYSEAYGQTFHSDKGALSEARQVFFAGSGVEARLLAGQASQVLEVGFGTGLNFFVTADAALKTSAPLSYTALEQSLLPADLLASLDYGDVFRETRLVERYLEKRRDVEPHAGPLMMHLGPGVELELRLGEASAQALPENRYHAVYHDAFSPDANPELWTEAFLRSLYLALRPGGALSSYCVKGTVRRRLQGIGFEVSKRPGPPGGKREVLFARRPP